ncbi:MAG: LysR family transcriptional regulator [Synechococcales bacterium]|nr:LysR family transcriptional regulator [Synechococcales bacterium]
MRDRDLNNLKLSQLRAFAAVAQYGNFSTAALELGLSQSTISHAIATLEEDLGMVLLNRGRHGASLTPAGAQLLPDVQQIFALIEEIYRKAHLIQRSQGGTIRVSCVRSIATHVLPDILARFRQAYPAVQVAIAEVIHYSEIEAALREGQVDIGFTCLPLSDEFDAWEICRDEFIALLPPDSLAPDEPLTWETLLTYPMVMNPLISGQHIQLLRDHLAQAGHTLKIDYEVRQDSTVLGMVQRSLGATIMPRLTAEPIPAGVQARSLPVPLERITGVAILARALLPQSAFAFLDIARELAGKL